MQKEPTLHQEDGMNLNEDTISSGNLQHAPSMQLASTDKRDSGYGTDVNSPASQTSGTSAPRRFTYDNSLHEEFETMELNEHDEVFTDSTGVADPDKEDDDDGDDTDKEVEDLLSDSVHNHSVSQPIDIQRPQAPIPTPEDDPIVKFTIGDDYDDKISRPLHHTSWKRTERQNNRFRPIASRSCGTQTPDGSPDGIASLPTRRPTSARGRGLSRLRLRSESEMTEGPSPLPDVIPHPRDRSVSLPEVPSYSRVHEREVGRELRRISDEFLSSFTPIQQRNGHSSSFPVRYNLDFHAAWNSIRRIMSSGSMTPEANDMPFKFPPNK